MSPSDLIYLDNAATAFPKPPAVIDAMADFYRKYGVNPGRSGYDLSVEAGLVIDGCRRKLDAFFNNPAGDPNRQTFGMNASDALNMIIQGICRPGDHVVSTCLEHNSVLRPLYVMEQDGIITHDLVPFDGDGFIDPDDIRRAIRCSPSRTWPRSAGSAASPSPSTPPRRPGWCPSTRRPWAST
jgi:cysteine desulfurase/selenocysteine lyase